MKYIFIIILLICTTLQAEQTYIGINSDSFSQNISSDYTYLGRMRSVDIYSVDRDKIQNIPRFPLSVDSPSYAQLLSNLLSTDIRSTSSYAGSYLIITHTNFLSAANILARWKRSMGYYVRIATLEETGTSSTSIHSYIQNAYNTFDNPPDYLLFIGDVSFPGGRLPDFGYASYTSDHIYGCVDGSSYFPDIMVGRLAVDTGPEALIAVTKIIKQEEGTLDTSEVWQRRGIGIATYLHAI